MKKIIPILFIINTSLWIISFSIAFVLLFRPFYYWHIKLLDIESKTGYTEIEIREAYDDVINYCIYNKPFKTGTFKYSEEGKDHFKDCRKLFLINFIILGITTIFLIIKLLFNNQIKIKKYSLSFWSGIGNISFFLFLFLITILIGFDNIFIKFHQLFFQGKTNWLLNPDKDQIINILPEQFFMNCAIFILGIIIIFSEIIIIYGIFVKKKCEKDG